MKNKWPHILLELTQDNEQHYHYILNTLLWIVSQLIDIWALHESTNSLFGFLFLGEGGTIQNRSFTNQHQAVNSATLRDIPNIFLPLELHEVELKIKVIN